MKKRMNAFSKITLVVLLVALVVASVVFSTGAATSTASATAEEGRTFTGDNAATNSDSRFELVKPLNEVPLTFEATFNLSSTAGCVLFGQYDGDKTGLYTNIEIYNGEITICYANNADLSNYNYICFNQFEDTKHSLANHLNKDVTIAITATPTAGENEKHEYTFRYYVNGELAHPPVTRSNVYFTKDNLTNAQKINPFAIGSNNCSTKKYNNFTGTMKNFSLYSDSLSDAEIKASYDAILAKHANSHSGLILNYDMTEVEDPYYEKDLSGNGHHACRADKAYIVRGEGRTFSGERLVLTKKIEKTPLTIEAVMKTTSEKTTIFGNTTTGGVGCLNLEIFSKKDDKGNYITEPSVALCFPVNESGTRGSIIFTPQNALSGVDYFTPNKYITNNDSEGFTQIVITATPTGADNTYNFDCYINGVKAYQTKTDIVAYLDAELIQAAGNLAIGANGTSNFSGNIRRVNLYDRPLTAAEIARSYKVDSTFVGLIAGYDMTDYTHIRNPQFEADISGNGYHAQKATNTGTGKWFDTTAGGDRYGAKPEIQAAAKPYFLWNELDSTPRTFEATVYSTANGNGFVNSSTIFGNFPNGTGSCINFELYGDSAALVYRTHNGTKYEANDSIVFTTKLPGNEWLHIVVVNEIVDGKSVYKLYVNGEYKESITTKTFVHDNIDAAQDIRLMSLGGSGKTSFNGGIIDVAIYSEALTAGEIADSFRNGVDKHNDSLMAYYDLKTVAGADFLQDLSGNNHHASRNDYTALEGGRWFNYDEERLAVVKNYEDSPLTINAEVYVPSTLKQAATIFGNLYARDYINFEIYTNGNPALVINEIPQNRIEAADNVGYKHSIIWDVDVRAEKWTDLTVVYDKTKTGADKYALYVDGVKIENYTLTGADINHVFEFDMEWIQRAIPFTLGRNASRCFQGKIKNLALYSQPLSAEEVAALYANGADLTSKDIMAYYNLDNPENTKIFVKDETGNGYDFAYKFFESESEGGDYDYSFAFIGDTQFLVYRDINEGTAQYTKPIYDWLIKNKDEKNLQYVFGLGDVSDDNMIAEYEYAAYLYQTLGDAGINYAVIPGNHDGHTAYENYDSVFKNDTYLTNGMNSYTAGSTTANYYKTFEVGEYKYMVMVLEFGAPDAVLAWANKEVAANSDRQVIVLTHGYIGYDGGFLSEKELHAPDNNKGLNSGEEIWEKFVSQHSNIIISACGHIDPYNIKQRYDVGKNGNVVNQFLIDPQGLDKTWSYDTGMIAMFYFSNGGKDVRVEYVSATQSLRAQEKNPDAKDIVFGKENQFNFTIDGAVASEVVTEYGNIPPINTNTEMNAVVLFDSNKTFIGGYTTVDKAFTALNEQSSTGSYVMLVRDNIRMSANVKLNNFDGELKIDLGGYELKIDQNGNYLFDIYRDNATAITAKYTVENGSITKAYGHGISCINYGSGLATNGNKFEFVYNDVTFKSISSINNTNVLFATWENGWSDGFAYTMTVDTVLNNCTFDMRNSIDNAVMIPMTYGSGKAVVHNIEVQGGKIIANDGADLSRFYTEDSADTIKFAKSENYTAITLPKGANAPTATYNGLEFVKVSETANEIIYRLRPVALSDIDFTPQMSITLESQIKINVYVPANSLQKFTFNGKTYEDFTELEKKTVEGKLYYLVSVSLPSAEAAEISELVATISVGEDVATATFTFSIFKYAEKVLTSDKSSEIEKILIKDVLAYVQSAYNYFTEVNTPEEIARVNEIITELLAIGEYNGEPSYEGEGTPNKTLVDKTALVLDEKPTIRFYFKKSGIEFFANGEKLKTKEGSDANGTYVDLDVYAYVLSEVITYKLGEESGTYHLYDYLYQTEADEDLMAEDNADALLSLIISFIKYTESAAAYRNSVIRV